MLNAETILMNDRLIPMDDRCMHLSYEVHTAFFDDFMVLLIPPMGVNVSAALPDAVQRHDDLFAFTH
jgi:hypothetical protein